MKLAPPLAAPAKIFTLSWSDFKNAFIAGPGPTYAISIEFANNDSTTWGPLSNNFVSIKVSSPSSEEKIPFSIPTIGTAWPTFGKNATRILFSCDRSAEFTIASARITTAILPIPIEIALRKFMKQRYIWRINNDRILAQAMKNLGGKFREKVI